MSMIKHFRDDEDYSPSLSQQKKDKATLLRLIHRYKMATPARANKLLIDINRIINRYMGGV